MSKEFHIWRCPRYGYEHRFWSEKPVPEYCPNCGFEPRREEVSEFEISN